MPTKLLIATRNQAKFAEFSDLLSNFKLKLVSLKDLGINQEVGENEPTFKANAENKARVYCELSGLPTIADDGGLEIEALGGWPGVYSRRIFGPDKPEGTDEEIINEVLQRLKGVPFSERNCSFTAAVSLAFSPQKLVSVAGKEIGYIAEQASQQSTPGFPFRSLFYLPAYKKVVVELDKEGKLSDFMTHRKQAIMELEPYLKQLANYA